jgi:hypothetical protein
MKTSDFPTIGRRRLMATGLRLALAWPLVAGAAACGSGGESGGETDETDGGGAAAAPEPSQEPAGGAGGEESGPTPGEALPAAPEAGAEGAADDTALVTAIAANESLVSALSYTHESDKPDQRCANCLLYTAVGGGRGKCQLFTRGMVKEGGWCSSWAPRP